MDLTPKQQASEAVRQAEAILLVTGSRPNIDQVASTVALAMILRKLGKKVTAVISDSVPSSTQFLTQSYVEKSLSGLRDFVIQLDLAKAEVDKLKYTIEDGKLNIHISPFRGGFQAQDVSFTHGDYHYDLVIALGVPARDRLDKVMSQNPQLFNIPLLNIDFHRVNQSYGAINLVDTNAATLSEMLVSLAESLQNGLIDEPIATAMLTGIIASTDRFTAPHTTAKAMTVAAQMMAAGAKQPQIIKALYGDQAPRPQVDKKKEQPKPAQVSRFAPSPAPQSQFSAAPEPVAPSIPNPGIDPVAQADPQPQPTPVYPEPAHDVVSAPAGEPVAAPQQPEPEVPTAPVHNPLEAPSYEPQPEPEHQPSPDAGPMQHGTSHDLPNEGEPHHNPQFAQA
jgi:nanoRNase/pAp phosphatase (c-di-AMP/oligoRNAs hydrolase)